MGAIYLLYVSTPLLWWHAVTGAMRIEARQLVAPSGPGALATEVVRAGWARDLQQEHAPPVAAPRSLPCGPCSPPRARAAAGFPGPGASRPWRERGPGRGPAAVAQTCGAGPTHAPRRSPRGLHPSGDTTPALP